ncbi:MAG: hypothetical protein Fur0022_03230 [Anaerolineales bacterium]
MTPTSPSPTRLTGPALTFVRIVGIALILLTIGLFSLGVPVQYREFQQPCFDPIEVCQQENRLLYPENVQALDDMGLTAQFHAGRKVFFDVLSGVVATIIGLLIFARRNDDWLAIMTAVLIVTLGTQGGNWQAAGRVYPILEMAAWGITSVSWILFGLFFGLFPNGKFVPGWMRWAVLVWALYFSIPPQFKINVPPIAGAIFPAFFALGLFAQAYRYRRVSTFDERQRTKWVVYGVAISMSGVLSTLIVVYAIFPTILFTLSKGYFVIQSLANVFVLCIPVSIGVAILRSRLWDIDVLIRRTLQYTLLTGLLALTYFGGVVLLQSGFRTLTGQTNTPLITVLSTLAIAALFNPLRRRVQDFIDRRFYRKKYNAERALAQFAVIARDEVDMDKLTAALIGVVNETVQPERVSLWLKTEKKRGGLES